MEQESAVFRVKNGDTVMLLITSDEAGTLHLHGYDHEDEVGTEGVTRMELVAELEGRFALALHPAWGWVDTLMVTKERGARQRLNCPRVSGLRQSGSRLSRGQRQGR